MKKFLSMTLLLTAMFLTFSACSKDDEGNSGLSQKEVSLKVGQSIALSYDGGECTWNSDQPLIAEVDNNGKVTANRDRKSTRLNSSHPSSSRMPSSA